MRWVGVRSSEVYLNNSRTSKDAGILALLQPVAPGGGPGFLPRCLRGGGAGSRRTSASAARFVICGVTSPDSMPCSTSSSGAFASVNMASHGAGSISRRSGGNVRNARLTAMRLRALVIENGSSSSTHCVNLPGCA